MNIATYEPSSLLSRFQREMFDSHRFQDDPDIGLGHWSPTVDIKEESDRFVIHADVPGVDPKDIDITLDRGVLTIQGERHFDKEEEKDKYRRVERVRGEFVRRFALPNTADEDLVTARTNNGVLEVTIPKSSKEQPRRIDIEE